MLNCSAFRRRAGPSESSGSAAASSGRGPPLKAALGGQHREPSFVVLPAECALVRPPCIRVPPANVNPQVTRSRGRGGTGRRAGFRSRSREGWRFDSSRPHSHTWSRSVDGFAEFAAAEAAASFVGDADGCGSGRPAGRCPRRWARPPSTAARGRSRTRRHDARRTRGSTPGRAPRPRGGWRR